MEPMISFVVKINIVLGIFFLFYQFLLSKHTLYIANRVYFLGALIVAILFSSIDPLSWWSSPLPLSTFPIHLPEIKAELTSGNRHWLWSDYALFIMCAGSFLLLVRLLIQLLSIHTLYKKCSKVIINAKPMLVTTDRVNPFSFFKLIFVNPQMHNACDLNQIIEHETIHVRQWHTIDIMLYEVATILFWYNPFVWLLRRSMKLNIEYITDRQMVKNGTNKHKYQYNLLRVSQLKAPISIVSNFNFNDLKKRIIMMNKTETTKHNVAKFLLLLPILCLTTLLLNAKGIKQHVDSPQESTNPKSESNNISANADKSVQNSTDSANVASIAFDKLEHDFGTINEADGKVSAYFTFINNSDKTLVISSVVASCGCAVPEWTKEPVKPNGVGIIRATYDPLGRVAPFDRTLTVYTNGNPNRIVLHIKGLVVR